MDIKMKDFAQGTFAGLQIPRYPQWSLLSPRCEVVGAPSKFSNPRILGRVRERLGRRK